MDLTKTIYHFMNELSKLNISQNMIFDFLFLFENLALMISRGFLSTITQGHLLGHLQKAVNMKALVASCHNI